jgi:hypothetical protein
MPRVVNPPICSSWTYLGKFVQLAFLSPELIERILAGEQPARTSTLALTAQRMPLS